MAHVRSAPAIGEDQEKGPAMMEQGQLADIAPHLHSIQEAVAFGAADVLVADRSLPVLFALALPTTCQLAVHSKVGALEALVVARLLIVLRRRSLLGVYIALLQSSLNNAKVAFASAVAAERDVLVGDQGLVVLVRVLVALLISHHSQWTRAGEGDQH